MPSSASTLSSCSTQRGDLRRSWNGRERDCLCARSRGVPASGRSSSAFEDQTASTCFARNAEQIEGPCRPTENYSRMRVGVRIRPAFEIEIHEHDKRSRGGYRPAVLKACPQVEGRLNGIKFEEDTTRASSKQASVELRVTDGRRRMFSYDYVFDATCQQHEVYQSLAAPVVEGCLAGLHGIILAYGQTASGKSHSMGVLQGVDTSTLDIEQSEFQEIHSGLRNRDERRMDAQGFTKPNGIQTHSHNQGDPGIIPRVLSRVFEVVQRRSGISPDDGSPVYMPMRVKVSLLQIYNETVQDLLTPTAPLGAESVGLSVREDPSVGFFVEGLREYSVHSNHEAAALINAGLQQRTTAVTGKNDISSRSHMVLTITLEHCAGLGLLRPTSAADVAAMAGPHAERIRRSKLVLVDLAGSERGTRSSIYLQEESGTERLREAGFINQSLSALGNVVAALGQAELNRPHIPFRDSKLTKILADSLGGGSNAALLATVGPAPQNQAESLSTLVFASRCMRVRSKPVTMHEESDQTSTTLRLQAQLSSMYREFCRREALQQRRYETVITRLAQELEYARSKSGSARPPSGIFEQKIQHPDPPSTVESHTCAPPWNVQGSTATAACRGTASYASTPTSDQRMENAAWGGDTKPCTAASSSVDGQTGCAESREGEERREGLLRDDDLDRAGAMRRMSEPPGLGAGDVREAVPAEFDHVGLEMLSAAIRTLEAVGQTGGEVVRQARDPVRQKQLDLHRQGAPAGDGCSTSLATETGPCLARLTKVQILQRFGQHRSLCQEQWAEAAAALSSALQEKARMRQMLEKETIERRRQESKARRLRGALQHLLEDGDDADCPDPPPPFKGFPGEERLGHEPEIKSSQSLDGSVCTH